MHRQLATVRRLDGISPHPNADRLSIGRVGGWDVVIPVSCTPDTIGVFFEVDSVVPGRVVGEDKNVTVKTRKIRGILSQGLFVPLDDLRADSSAWTVGQDVTQALDVEQVLRLEEDALVRQGCRPGARLLADVVPAGVHRTSEKLLQSSMWLLNRLRGKPYYISLKYDGSSGTFVLDNGQLTVCSRNQEAGEGSVYSRAAKIYNLEELSRGRRLVLQGEVYGAGINGNKHRLSAVRLAVFNVFDITAGRYMALDDMTATLQELKLPAVLVLDEGTDFQHDLKSLLALAEGRYEGTSNLREGIVVRARDQSYSFKVLNNDYLLKYES